MKISVKFYHDIQGSSIEDVCSLRRYNGEYVWVYDIDGIVQHDIHLTRERAATKNKEWFFYPKNAPPYLRFLDGDLDFLKD